MEGQHESVARKPCRFPETDDVQEHELVGEHEVFLQQAVARRDLLGPGNHRLVRREAHGPNRLGREIESALRGVLHAQAAALCAKRHVQRPRQRPVAARIEVQAHVVEPDLGKRRTVGERQLDSKAAAPPQGAGARIRHPRGRQGHVVAGSEPASPSADRPRRHLGASRHGHPGAPARRRGEKLDHGHGGDRGQQVRRDDLRQRLGELRQLVVELLAQPSGEEREPLQQPLHVRVEALARQERSEARIPGGELGAELLEVAQLLPIVRVEVHRPQLTSTAPLGSIRVSSTTADARSAPTSSA